MKQKFNGNTGAKAEEQSQVKTEYDENEYLRREELEVRGGRNENLNYVNSRDKELKVHQDKVLVQEPLYLTSKFAQSSGH